MPVTTQTAQLCHDEMIRMLRDLFDGRTFCAPEGKERELRYFRQNLPLPTDNDLDADTEASCCPYILTQLVGGEIKDNDSPQILEFSLIVCTYDSGTDRDGFRDVANIVEEIVQHVCSMPFFGSSYTVLKPIAWALQIEDTWPYYYGALNFSVTAPAASQDSYFKELI